MLGNVFPCFPSSTLPLQKGSLCTTNLQTSINTQLDSLSYDMIHNEYNNHHQNQHQIQESSFLVGYQEKQTINYRKGRENFENSFALKFQELQEKSSKIISKLPNIHSKTLKTTGQSHIPTELPFLLTSSAYSNKLRIILDLEEKIGQLQDNINNPLTCHEYMQNITKEININFQNYYQQAKQKTEYQKQDNSMGSDEEFIDQQDYSITKQGQINKETQTSFIESKDYDIVVYTPKIIEIEVPFEVIRHKAIEKASELPQKSNSGSDPLSINSHPNYKKQSIEQSSIQNIINQFNDRFYPSIHENSCEKDIYIYRINKVEQENNQILEKEEFHLPLDSYQRCESQRGDKGIVHLLKKTDRSNISSSNSQIEHLRNQIWNKDEIEFNHQNLSLVKENQHKSQQNSDHHFSYEDSQREKLLINLNQKISILTEENLQMRGQIEELTKQNDELVDEAKAKQNKNIQLQILYFQEADRIDEFIQTNNGLHDQISKYKECISRLQSDLQYVNEKIKNDHKNYLLKMEEKQSQLHDLFKTIQYKTQELDDCLRTNEEIRLNSQSKDEEHERHISELQQKVVQHKEEINFYKAKLEEQGLNLKFEEAKLIKEMIEKKQEDEQEIMLTLQKTIENKYKNKLIALSSDKEILLHEVEELKKNSKKSLGSLEQLSVEVKDDLEKEIQQLLTNYNIQLYKKDEQIINLRKLSSEYRQQLNENTSSAQQLMIIKSIKNILIKEKMDKDNISNNMVQFVYLIDKLLCNIKIYEYATHREKEERLKLTKKITNLNIFFNRQLQKSQENNSKLQKQAANAKKQVQELNKQLKKVNSKLQIYKNKLDQPENNCLYNIYELQNEYLQIENKKLNSKYEKIKQYCEELQGKFLNEFFKEGNCICEHISVQKNESAKEKKQEQQFQRKISEILHEMKDQYHKSVLIGPQESIIQSKGNIKNFGINSSVVCVTSRPTRISKNTAIKALMTPLPEIPKSSPTPTASITLDKLLQKRLCTSDTYKHKVTLKLLQLGIELNKVSKKLFSLKPSQVLVNYTDGEVDIILRREFGNSMEEDQSSLIYRAPEVLLGFNESEGSYVWTIGLIIDQIYHEKLFYKKINEILSHKNNYHVRNEGLVLKPLLQAMMRKNHKERPSLMKVKEELLQLLL